MTSVHKKKIHIEQKDRMSTEMYLKTIYILSEENDGNVKPVDLINKMNLSKASVSEMLKKLKEDELVTYSRYEDISLTKKGIVKGKNILRKYIIIKKFLEEVLKLDKEKCPEEACNLEHAFSDESVARLNIVMKLLEEKTATR